MLANEQLLSIDEFRIEVRSIVEKLDMVTFDEIKACVYSLPGVVYQKRDFLFRSGDWRSERVKRLSRRTLRGKVLVTGHSDRDTSLAQCLCLKALGAKRVMGANVRHLRGFSGPMPLGLTNDYPSDGPFHSLLGDKDLLKEAYELSASAELRSDLPYVNFNPLTSPKHRETLGRLVESNGDRFRVRECRYTREDRLAFLSDLLRSEFTLCPRGNGFDTHRVWEALYMGSSPVVLDSARARRVYAEMPVVFLNRWQDLLSDSFASWAREDLVQRRFSVDRLRLSYWKSVLTIQSENRSDIF